MTEFNAWAAAHRARTETALVAALPVGELRSGRLLEAMRYGTLGGGKRLRALLSYAAAETIGADSALADAGAVAVELIHAYSLIHDDLPCMDNDDMRRGKPTNHKVFGEAAAMLAGDALQPLAFAVIAHAPASASGRITAVAELAQAAGALGMAGGQAIDLANVGRPMIESTLEEMHALKTGAMFEAAVVLPALLAAQPANVIAALRTFAQKIGLAFQVMDDVLDIAADSAALGKTAGKDALSAKPTFTSIMGINAARAYVGTLTEGALVALSALEREMNFRAVRLRELAQVMAERKS